MLQPEGPKVLSFYLATEYTWNKETQTPEYNYNEYQFEKGMTWKGWFDSSFNTVGFKNKSDEYFDIELNSMFFNTLQLVGRIENGNSVYARLNDAIIDEQKYYLLVTE